MIHFEDIRVKLFFGNIASRKRSDGELEKSTTRELKNSFFKCTPPFFNSVSKHFFH